MSENNFSTYDIARMSGNAINANTITRILNGDIQEAKLSTLEAISTAFSMPIDEIVRVVRGEDPKPTRFKIYAERFDGGDLSDTEWQLLETYFNDHVQKWKAAKEQREKDIEEFLRNKHGD